MFALLSVVTLYTWPTLRLDRESASITSDLICCLVCLSKSSLMLNGWSTNLSYSAYCTLIPSRERSSRDAQLSFNENMRFFNDKPDRYVKT
uniref:Uncharacterized protein n=1 Tax=Ixodes ricinus TaxID=34613 RepID=A0A0K8RE29_IXORI